jgi:O-antigen ligase
MLAEAMGLGVTSLGTADAPHDPAQAPSRRARARAKRSAPVGLTVLGLWLLSFNDARVGGQKVSDWCFVLAAGAVIANLLSGRTQKLAPVAMRRTPPLVLLGSLVLMTAGALSSLFAVDPITSMLEVARYGSVTLLWFWLLRAVTQNRETLWRLVRAFKATVLLSCFGAALGLFGVLQMNGDPSAPNANRQSAWFNHPNLLAFLLATGLPLFFLDVPRVTSTSEVQRLVRRWVPTAIVTFFLASTGSITGMMAAGAGLVVMAVAGELSSGRARRGAQTKPGALFAGFIIVPIAVVALLQSGAPVVERFDSFRGGNASIEYSVESRDKFNEYAVDQIGDRLLVGIGLDLASHKVFPPPSSAAAAHNMYLTVLVDLGLPGLVGLVIILWWALKTGWQLVRKTQDPELYPLALALLASTVTAIITAYFHPTQHFRVYWFPVAMISVLWGLRRQELADAAAEPRAV